VLAALLLAGGAVLALRRERPPTELGSTTLATLVSGPSTTLASIDTGPSTTAGPAVVATGPGPTSPRTTARPDPTTSTTARPSTTTTTPATTVAAPPAIRQFTATVVAPSRLCVNDQQVQLAWSTTGATSVMLTGPGAPTKAQPASGTATACAPASLASPVYVLTATGPGGQASAKDAA